MLNLDFYKCKADHRLVSVADVDYVLACATECIKSTDPELHISGMAAMAVLERLGLKENAPEAATSKGNNRNNITALL